MKRTKTLSALAAALTAGALLLTGCAGDDTSTPTKNNAPQATSGEMRSDLTASELVTLMGNGVNLGNTMEAYGHSANNSQAPSHFETLWGQPITTQAMVDGMKAAGFDSMRVPIAWTNAIAYESGDYTINDAYLARVEEIINYGLNAGMYVIINDHWDGGWWGMFGSKTEATRTKAMEMYKSIWTQIATRYKNYSDYLIFESANEELGDRLNDKDVAKDSGSLSEDQCYETANLINQTFVDTVRATGGNNALRFLLIAGYNTDVQKTVDDRYKMPTDTANAKLLVSVHYYTPWNYCGTDGLNHWGKIRDYKEQNQLLELLTKFTDAGYGVVLGEYGVLTDGHTPKADTDKFISNFLDNCDLYNYCPVLWDCNNLYSRDDGKILDAGIAELFSTRSYTAQKNLTEQAVKDNAQNRINETLAAAPASFDNETAVEADENTAVAWIMYSSADYSKTYSVGDKYDPASKSDGVVAENVVIKKAGTYTVSLDFSKSGIAKGVSFSALGIFNGEKLFPGYIITIDRIEINGEPFTPQKDFYTNSDDENTTRVNLYNSWVSKAPDDARTADGSLDNVSPVNLDIGSLAVSKISVTFTYSPGK
ncbi:MAG: glycoside hydrolase family 5 protein [Oscillospiraceae bacterium]